MKKQGFTLVELLAVIAILAILVIIALPNIMSMFNQARKNSFTTEIKEIYKVAQQQWISDSLFTTSDKVYSRCESGCNSTLDLSGRQELEYYIKIDKSGKVTNYYATDGTYQYSYNGGDLKIEDIDGVEQVAGLEESQIVVIGPAGLAIPTDVSYFTYYYGENDGYEGIIITAYSSEGPKDVVIPDYIDGQPVIALGDDSFINLGLTSVVLPSTLKRIDGYENLGVFHNNKLTSIIFPSGIRYIGTGAFSNNELTSVTIPESVYAVCDGAFDYNKIKTVTIYSNGDIEGFEHNEIEHINFAMTGTGVRIVTDAFAYNKLKSVTIPNNISNIFSNAFAHNEIKSLTISNGVTSISSDAFNDNPLETLTIDMTTIPSDVFRDGQYRSGGNIKTLILGEHVQNISSSAFQGNKITTLTIPSNVKKVGLNAFASNQLRSIVIKGKSSSSQFTNWYSGDKGWADDVTCVIDNTSNVTNGCITWEP